MAEDNSIEATATAAATTTDGDTVTETMEIEVKKTTPKSATSSGSTSGGSSGATAAASKKTDAYRVCVPLLNIRKKASLASEIVGALQEGDVVEVEARTPAGFGRLSDGDGYVKLEYTTRIEEAGE